MLLFTLININHFTQKLPQYFIYIFKYYIAHMNY